MCLGVTKTRRASPSAAHALSRRTPNRRGRYVYPDWRSALVWTEHYGNKTCYTLGTMALLLEHTLLEAHDPVSGRYDALRVGHSLGLSAAEIAQVIGWTARGVRKNPT